MKNDALVSIIGSDVRAILMRIFVTDKDKIFKPKDLSTNLKVTPQVLNDEIKFLLQDGIIRKRKGTERSVGKNKKDKNVEFSGYSFNRNYEYRAILESLVLQTLSIANKSFVRVVGETLGHLDLFVTAGVFSRRSKDSVDMLVVAEKVNPTKMKVVTKELSKLVGKEVRVIYLDTNDFVYRYNLNDKSIRDILDNSPQVHIDGLKIFKE